MMEFNLIGNTAGIYEYLDMEYSGNRHSKLYCHFNGRIYSGSNLKRYCEKNKFKTIIDERGLKVLYKVKISDGIILFEMHPELHHIGFHSAESLEEAKRWLEKKLGENIAFDSFVQFMQDEFPLRYTALIDKMQRLANVKRLGEKCKLVQGLGRISWRKGNGEIYFGDKKFDIVINTDTFDADSIKGVKIKNAPENVQILEIKKSKTHQDSLYMIKAVVPWDKLIIAKGE